MRAQFPLFSTFCVSVRLTHNNRALFAGISHVSSKVNLYKSLHTKLADEHSSLDQRAIELRGASQALVRDSGNIAGGLGSNNI